MRAAGVQLLFGICVAQFSGGASWFDSFEFELAQLQIGNAEYSGKLIEIDGQKIEIYRGNYM